MFEKGATVDDKVWMYLVYLAIRTLRSRGELDEVVAPPRPKDVPKLGTVDECHMRAWFSICNAPSAVYSFLRR